MDNTSSSFVNLEVGTSILNRMDLVVGFERSVGTRALSNSSVFRTLMDENWEPIEDGSEIFLGEITSFYEGIKLGLQYSF